MAIGSGKRIEFEREVFSRNTLAPAHIAPRRRSRALPIIALVVLLAGVAAVGGAVAVRSGFFNSEKRAIERMSKTLVNGLAEGDGARAIEVCAESAEGAKLIAEEEGRVFGEGATTTPASIDAQLALLRAMRSELEKQGVVWSNATPYAFGGVRARVEGAAMKQPLTVLTGEVYFRSQGRVFAIELSAWRCDGKFVVVDIWKSFPMSDSVTDLAAFSAEQAAKLQQQAADSNSLTVSYLKQMYVEF
ncbi:MAG: hypothetical protein IT366_11900 [Candidatus Hydrogenedentes bacterium]|nr:hypothetical protein [Candidatus Hydrogenedentota bacterium]